MMNKSDIEELFKTHYQRLHRMAIAMLHDADTARDIVHDVFSTLLTSGAGASLPATYLFTAVRNRCLNHLRDQSARDRIAQLYFLDSEDYESEEWPDEATGPSLRGSHFHRFENLSLFAKAHDISCSSRGMRLWPSSVSEYSTLGGISAYSLREINPSASRFRSVSVRTFGDMSGIALQMDLKRVDSFVARTHIMSIDHLPEKRDMMLRTGHSDTQVNFFKFSSNCNGFIFKIAYPEVSE